MFNRFKNAAECQIVVHGEGVPGHEVTADVHIEAKRDDQFHKVHVALVRSIEYDVVIPGGPDPDDEEKKKTHRCHDTVHEVEIALDVPLRAGEATDRTVTLPIPSDAVATFALASVRVSWRIEASVHAAKYGRARADASVRILGAECEVELPSPSGNDAKHLAMTIEDMTPQILSPGTTIVGTVVVRAAQQLQVRGIQMQFGATATVEGKDAKYLKRHFVLYASDNAEGPSVLEAGRELRLPFSLAVPENLPVPSVGWKSATPTSGCSAVGVTWWVRAEVDQVSQVLHLSHARRHGVAVLVQPRVADPH